MLRLFENIGNIQFDSAALLLLALLIVPYIFIRIMTDRARSIQYAPLQFRGSTRLNRYSIIGMYAMEAILLLTVLAGIAGPHLKKESRLILEDGIDIALVLDVSASMQAKDFKPNRLEALKDLSSEFIRRSGSSRIGVFIFARDVFTQTPFTTDHGVLLELIKSISFKSIEHDKSGGTAIGDALLTASDGLLRIRVQKRDQSIILITDGENSFGMDPILAAKNARDGNIRLYIIGLAGENPVQVYVDGKPYLTPSGKVLTTALDDRQLRKIADEGGGKFYRAKNAQVLTEIFSELSRMERSPLEVKKFNIKESFSPHTAAISLIIFLIFIFIDGFFLRRPMR
jgi:Ca-activated chloride channel family protein